MREEDAGDLWWEGFLGNRGLGLVIVFGFGYPRIQSLKVKSKSDKQFAANLQLNWRVWDSPLDLEFGVF